MITGPTRRLGDDTLEAEIGEVEVTDEDIDHSDWIVLGHIVVEARRQQRALAAIFTCHETTHSALPPTAYK